MSYGDFCKVCEKKKKIEEEEKNEEIFTKFCSLISRKRLKGFLSNLKLSIPCMGSNSTANLVQFGWGITELRMRENRNFVVPVNILTLCARAPFLGPHDSVS